MKKKRGYDVSVTTSSSYYIPNALHVEKIDELNMFEDDDEACIQAEKDGLKFIYNMDGVPNRVYIDTPENRRIIKEQLLLHPEYLQKK